ncbi:hypothetical protein [Agromyces sp. NPDC055661]
MNYLRSPYRQVKITPGMRSRVEDQTDEIVQEIGKFSEVAANYSALAAVLAGFAFACLTTIALSPGLKPNRENSVMMAASPMTALFVSLVLVSLNYAVVAGESDGTPRLATIAVVTGIGFTCAGILLPYVLLVLLGAAAADEQSRRSQLNGAVGILKISVALAAPLLMLLQWSALRQAEILNEQMEFGAADWWCIGAATLLLLNSILALVGVYARVPGLRAAWRFFQRKQHSVLRWLSITAIGIAIAAIAARVFVLVLPYKVGWSIGWLVAVSLVYAVFAFFLTLSAMTYEVHHHGDEPDPEPNGGHIPTLQIAQHER